MGVPVIPGLSCSSAAAALGASGLGPACQSALGAAAGPVSSLPSQVAGFGADSVLNAAANWVTSGATWLLGQIGTALQSSTQIDLGASWFTTHFETMAGLAGVVIVPLLLLGVVQAIHRQSTSMLLRSILVNVPVALLLTGAAVKLVQLGLALVDAMSSDVAHGAGLDTGHFLSATVSALSGPLAGAPATPAFVLFLGGLAVVFGSFLLWIELMVRAAAVYVAVLFLPLALASLAWPAVAHWCRRLVDVLVGLILSKFVIVTVLSLAVSALAGGTNGQGSGGGFSAVLGGAALLLLAAAAPWALFRLLPFAEAAAISHLEGVGPRSAQTMAGPAKRLAQSALKSAGIGGGGAAGAAGALALAAGHAVGASATSAAGGGADGGAPRPTGASTTRAAQAPVRAVGEETEPGSSVPSYPVSAEGSDAFQKAWEEMEAGLAGAAVSPMAVSGAPSALSFGSSTPSSAPRPGASKRSATSSSRPLSAPSGSTRLHVLGHDDLGPQLRWVGDRQSGGRPSGPHDGEGGGGPSGGEGGDHRGS